MLIAFWAVAAVSRSRWWLLRPDRRQVAGLVAVGVAITILFERLATSSVHPGWGWRYADAMPLLPGTEVGLSPLAQWIILPPLAIWFVRRQLETRAPQLKSDNRSEENTSELQSLMRISYAVFCLKKKNEHTQNSNTTES